MMATPEDFKDFALGFSLSERIIKTPEEIENISVVDDKKGVIVNVTIPEERHIELIKRRRGMTGWTGCGLCGVESLEDAVPELPAPVKDNLRIAPQAVYSAFDNLHPHQPEKQATGAVHAAAWCHPDGGIIIVREDVGRHNALDKLIGAMHLKEMDFQDGFCLITSRCSYEMLQKTAQAGIPLLAAISAPTALAVEMAETAGVTLIALARKENFTVFTHGHRITEDEQGEKQ